MALYHLTVSQIRRSAGQSAIAAAAYRAGECLYSDYYGEYSDYTRKGGVICSEILLPPHAPLEYQDRATLWNTVEQVEKHKKAQLAYSFDIALQNELSMEENIALAREFVEQIILNQQSQIDTIVGVRGDLIDALSKEFSGNDLSVKVDAQSGAITFDSTLLFGYNDDKLQDSGKTFLAEFLPKYFSVLLGKDFSPYVAEIIIEGHTDTDGGYMYNLQLSQNRAFAVVSYCLDENNHFLSDSQLEELRVLLTANGRSWSAPIYAADGTVDMQASRRVEIKFRLKDEEMINQIAEMLEETK